MIVSSSPRTEVPKEEEPVAEATCTPESAASTASPITETCEVVKDELSLNLGVFKRPDASSKARVEALKRVETLAAHPRMRELPASEYRVLFRSQALVFAMQVSDSKWLVVKAACACAAAVSRHLVSSFGAEESDMDVDDIQQDIVIFCGAIMPTLAAKGSAAAVACFRSIVQDGAELLKRCQGIISPTDANYGLVRCLVDATTHKNELVRANAFQGLCLLLQEGSWPADDNEDVAAEGRDEASEPLVPHRVADESEGTDMPPVLVLVERAIARGIKDSSGKTREAARAAVIALRSVSKARCARLIDSMSASAKRLLEQQEMEHCLGDLWLDGDATSQAVEDAVMGAKKKHVKARQALRIPVMQKLLPLKGSPDRQDPFASSVLVPVGVRPPPEEPMPEPEVDEVKTHITLTTLIALLMLRTLQTQPTLLTHPILSGQDARYPRDDHGSRGGLHRQGGPQAGALRTHSQAGHLP
jgi:hypothetical protein